MKEQKSRKVKQTAMEAYSGLVENFLRHVGFKEPEKCRLESSGKERAGWCIPRGSATTFIFLEDTEDRNALRIESPILRLPDHNILPFYRRCLEINTRLRGCALAAQDDAIVLVSDRPLEGLDPEELARGIDSLTFYADNLDDELSKEFGAKLYFSKEGVA